MIGAILVGSPPLAMLGFLFVMRSEGRGSVLSFYGPVRGIFERSVLGK